MPPACPIMDLELEVLTWLPGKLLEEKLIQTGLTPGQEGKKKSRVIAPGKWDHLSTTTGQ